MLKHMTRPTFTLFLFLSIFCTKRYKILNLRSSLRKKIYIFFNRWRNHSLSLLHRDTEWTDGSFRHQLFLILSPFMLNLQTMDSCIMLFKPQLRTKSIFLLGNEKKTLDRKKQDLISKTQPSSQSAETKRRALSFHRAAWWHILPQHTWLYTFKQVIQIHSFRGKCALSEPFGLNLTFPQATMDRASWYQRWNSSNANFMALSRHWERNDERNIRLYFPPYIFYQDYCLGRKKVCWCPGDPGGLFLFFFFNYTIYTSNGTC